MDVTIKIGQEELEAICTALAGKLQIVPTGGGGGDTFEMNLFICSPVDGEIDSETQAAAKEMLLPNEKLDEVENTIVNEAGRGVAYRYQKEEGYQIRLEAPDEDFHNPQTITGITLKALKDMGQVHELEVLDGPSDWYKSGNHLH